MELQLTLIAVVALALFFDFTNGFHDAANAIATSVCTRALTPRDPAEQLTGILLTQTAMDTPTIPRLVQDFWPAAYQALDD